MALAEITAGSSATLTLTASNNGTQLTSFDSITLTLKDQKTGGIINSRSAQSIKNANGGTVAGDGTLTLVLGASDNPFVGTGLRETHIASFIFTSGSVVATHRAELIIKALL